MKIEKLTPEQEAKLPEYRDKWLKIGLSTEPLDFEAAKKAACAAYRVAGLAEPEYFFAFRSPMEAAREIAKMQGTTNLNGIISDQIYGCHDAGWLSFYDVMLDLGIEEVQKLIPLMDLAKVCGWWSPYKNYVVFQDRPELIKMDDRNLLHCEDGPAIRYRDGFSVYSWHGVRIPAEWITDRKSLSAKTALTWANMEERRAACEIVGWANILNELNAVTINKDVNPEIGELVEVNLPDIGKEKFLCVRCGTGRDFAIPVPKEMKTAHEANAWTYGLDVAEYEPEVRT